MNDFIETTFEDKNFFMKNYNPNENTTSLFLSVYEKTHIIGSRITQLANGANTYLPKEILTKMSVKDIALEEFNRKLLPFIVIRRLPNGNKEYWKIDDLIY